MDQNDDHTSALPERRYPCFSHHPCIEQHHLQQAGTITQAVRACGDVWDVQAIDDYDGYLSILIEPTVRSDEQKAFFISGTAQRLELFEAHDDNLIPVADFSDVERLSIQLLDLIDQQ